MHKLFLHKILRMMKFSFLSSFHNPKTRARSALFVINLETVLNFYKKFFLLDALVFRVCFGHFFWPPMII